MKKSSNIIIGSRPRGRPRAKNPRSTQVYVRLSPAEKKACRLAAEIKGFRTMSDLLRPIIVAATKNIVMQWQATTEHENTFGRL